VAPIEDDILTEFYRRLGDSTDVTPLMIEELRDTLASTAKLKPEALVSIFGPPPEEQIP